jgi:hypothetical protein
MTIVIKMEGVPSSKANTGSNGMDEDGEGPKINI